ncbi:hypothetical protein B484DRAFT_21444 [Ochromonadaceae sp. CCMP2298]|nr:hypothetical protein B484DRAFT_21444 [Ochromonadaceae sp. CCMP2298]
MSRPMSWVPLLSACASLSLLPLTYYYLIWPAERRLLKISARKRALRLDVVEVCISDLASLKEALEGGATSIELCGSRCEGGITPSAGLIQQSVAAVRSRQCLLHVLIR